MSCTRPRSRHTYTWNHFGPSLTAATSSMLRVASVDSVYGSPRAAAARATASSPCGSAMRVKPVGDRAMGAGSAARHAPVAPVPTAGPTTMPADDPAGFRSGIEPVTAAQLSASWRPGCPIPVDQLRAVDADFWGFDGRVHHGTVIVDATEA